MGAYIAKSKSDDHGTPAEVWECVRRTFRCRAVDLDPAASRKHTAIVQARQKYFGPKWGSDGADLPWRGRVYNNPPYGREIPRFIKRARAEYHGKRAKGIIQLLPHRSAAWFLDDILPYATAICFIRGRLVFEGSIDPYPIDSVAVLWGARYKEAFREAFSKYVPRSPVKRAESTQAMKKRKGKRRRTWWVELGRPLGSVLDLEEARREPKQLELVPFPAERCAYRSQLDSLRCLSEEGHIGGHLMPQRLWENQA